MKRRELIAVLGSCVVWPFGARAQQPLKIHRIASYDLSTLPRLYYVKSANRNFLFQLRPLMKLGAGGQLHLEG